MARPDTPTPDAATGPALSLEPDRQTTDRPRLYPDQTLVLVGCGAAKRDPTDDADLHAATIQPDETWGGHDGPLWRAEDLYTSTYFQVKRELAETLTHWTDAGEDTLGGWAVLSAEHGILPHWQPVAPYDTTIEDLGTDPTEPDHRVDNPLGRRRPDGREIVTKMDHWTATVATGLARWLASFRDAGRPDDATPTSLVVLAGSSYVEPLQDRGVFEYGISRLGADPNTGWTLPIEPRFLFDEIDAGGIGEQMGWMSDAIDRLEAALPDDSDASQPELGAWTGDQRACSECNQTADAVTVREYDGTVYCEDCAPAGRCRRCGRWTHDRSLGGYPLCPGCQTERGGQKRDPIDPGPRHTQGSLSEF